MGPYRKSRFKAPDRRVSRLWARGAGGGSPLPGAWAHHQAGTPPDRADPVFAHPIKLFDTPGEVRATAPILGEHNRTGFQELLGLPAEEIARLSADGVIA
ncbi:MAG: hypothetical protein WAP47_17810 [Candidatus Rokuibacteriota bacterium]